MKKALSIVALAQRWNGWSFYCGLLVALTAADAFFWALWHQVAGQVPFGASHLMWWKLNVAPLSRLWDPVFGAVCIALLTWLASREWFVVDELDMLYLCSEEGQSQISDFGLLCLSGMLGGFAGTLAFGVWYAPVFVLLTWVAMLLFAAGYLFWACLSSDDGSGEGA